MKYKSKFNYSKLNKSFWKEVLENRKIKKINWSTHGIKSLTLDSGEEVFLESNTLMIKYPENDDQIMNKIKLK